MLQLHVQYMYMHTLYVYTRFWYILSTTGNLYIHSYDHAQKANMLHATFVCVWVLNDRVATS
jgi:hypothetical protein